MPRNRSRSRFQLPSVAMETLGRLHPISGIYDNVIIYVDFHIYTLRVGCKTVQCEVLYNIMQTILAPPIGMDELTHTESWYGKPNQSRFTKK